MPVASQQVCGRERRVHVIVDGGTVLCGQLIAAVSNSAGDAHRVFGLADRWLPKVPHRTEDMQCRRSCWRAGGFVARLVAGIAGLCDRALLCWGPG